MKPIPFRTITVSAIFVLFGALGAKGVIPIDGAGRHGCGIECVWIGWICALFAPLLDVDWKFYITNEHEEVALEKLSLKEGICQGLFAFSIVGIMIHLADIIRFHDYFYIGFLICMSVCGYLVFKKNEEWKI